MKPNRLRLAVITLLAITIAFTYIFSSAEIMLYPIFCIVRLRRRCNCSSRSNHKLFVQTLSPFKFMDQLASNFMWSILVWVSTKVMEIMIFVCYRRTRYLNSPDFPIFWHSEFAAVAATFLALPYKFLKLHCQNAQLCVWNQPPPPRTIKYT